MRDIEGAAALAVAAFIKNGMQYCSKVVFLICGGNFARQLWPDLANLSVSLAYNRASNSIMLASFSARASLENHPTRHRQIHSVKIV